MEWRLIGILIAIFFISNFVWAKINGLDYIKESKKHSQIMPLIPQIILTIFIFYFILGNLGFWSSIGHWFVAGTIYSLLVW